MFDVVEKMPISILVFIETDGSLCSIVGAAMGPYLCTSGRNQMEFHLDGTLSPAFTRLSSIDLHPLFVHYSGMGTMNSPGSPLVQLTAPTGVDEMIVHEWMEADHVRRFWGDPHKNLRQYRQNDDGSQQRIVKTGNRKVGLILWQHPTRRELDEAGLVDIPESVVDIDIMIGELDMVGRGIGSAAIRMVAEQSLVDAAVPFVIAATRTDNVASRRAFEKAGFQTDREFDDPGYGRCVLMIRRRSASQSAT